MDEINAISELAKLGIVPIALGMVWILWKEYKLMVLGRIADLQEEAERENSKTIITR